MLQEVNKIFSGANKYFLPGHASELVEHGDGVVAGGGRAPVRLPDLAHVGHDVAGVGAHHRHAAPAVLQLQVGGPEVSMVTACHVTMVINVILTTIASRKPCWPRTRRAAARPAQRRSSC